MNKIADPRLSLVLVVFLAFLTSTASTAPQFGSFAELGYSQIVDESITSIEGFCYGGGYIWAISSGGVLIKIDPSGIIVSKVDILTTGCHGGICYDNGTLWVVTDESQILPFDTSGNSLGSGVDFSGLSAPFTGSFGDVYGAVKVGDGFWLYNFWVPMLFKVDMSGNLVKQYPNSWLDQGLSTIAMIGNKILKFTFNDPRSNQWWNFYEALAVDVETGEVSDSWEYPNNMPGLLGLSAGDGFLWTLEFRVFTSTIAIRKLSVPDPLAPPDIPSTQWGDFTIKRWGYPPLSPPMLNGLYGFGYDRGTNKMWFGTGYEQLWAASDIGTRNFPLIGTWASSFNAEPRDIAIYNNDMWLLEHYNTMAAKMVGQVQTIGDPVQFSREWEAGMGKVDGLATNGTYIWVSGRVDYQSTGDPMNTIRKYDLDGELLATFQYPETTNYEDLAWHRGGLWAIHMSTTSFSAQIHKIDIDDGTVLATYQTGWASNPDDNIQGTLASNGESLLTFAALSYGGESYQNSHLRLIEIQLPSDQVPDDVLATWEGYGVYYRNSDTGAWARIEPTPATRVEGGDLDGDGQDDLIGIWPQDPGIWVKFSATNSWAMLDALKPEWLAVGDMNGDTRDDLVCTWMGYGVYYRNSMTGAWIRIEPTPATHVAAGDLDGDGRDDLIGMWAQDPGIWVKFSSTQAWAMVDSLKPEWLTVGDMNGDARDDLVCTWAGYGVYYRDSMTGNWVRIEPTPATQITVGQLDGDANADLIGMWAQDPGIWVKHSMTNSWAMLDPLKATWIETGKMRLGSESSSSAGTETLPLARQPSGRLFLGLGSFEDLSSVGPGGANFIYAPDTGHTGLKKIDEKRQRQMKPGPGEPGFRPLIERSRNFRSVEKPSRPKK